MKKLKKILKNIMFAILATAKNWRIYILLLLIKAGGYCMAASPSLLDAIERVESGCNPKAIGDNGDAVGSFQLHTEVIDDVNRICKKSFKYTDRKDRKKSREIASLYIDYWAKHYTKKTGKDATDEVRAKIFNGGPNGYKNKNTEKYWNEVRKELKNG